MTQTAITLRKTKIEELSAICQMEQGEARDFVISYSLEKHTDEFRKPSVLYKSILQGAQLVGFVVLALDPDGRSLEFRRIVVSEPGRGIGKRVVAMVKDLCSSELGRERVWLDVFETNARARRVYESSGYKRFGTSEHDGRTLIRYETTA